MMKKLRKRLFRRLFKEAYPEAAKFLESIEINDGKITVDNDIIVIGNVVSDEPNANRRFVKRGNDVIELY